MVVVMMKAAGVGVVMVVMVVIRMLLLYPDVPQVSVLADQLIYPPVQLFYS